MITYYLKPKEIPFSNLTDNYKLGLSNGFSQFWVGEAYQKLQDIIQKPELSDMIDEVEIYDDKKKQYTIYEFLNQIEMLKFLGAKY